MSGNEQAGTLGGEKQKSITEFLFGKINKAEVCTINTPLKFPCWWFPSWGTLHPALSISDNKGGKKKKKKLHLPREKGMVDLNRDSKNVCKEGRNMDENGQTNKP